MQDVYTCVDDQLIFPDQDRCQHEPMLALVTDVTSLWINRVILT